MGAICFRLLFDISDIRDGHMAFAPCPKNQGHQAYSLGSLENFGFFGFLDGGDTFLDNYWIFLDFLDGHMAFAPCPKNQGH